jgi:hypothetical protein
MFTTRAQSPALYSSELDTVGVSSFYKISLIPALVANCQLDFRDLRIIENETGREVPYILKSDAATFSESSFVNFPILSVKKEADKQTHIILKANHTQPIDNLLLFIKNTDAVRSVTLSGSDNNKDWFVIKENIYLDEYFNRINDQFIQTLSFAPSKYAFYKLIIIGENILPVNIMKAGLYNSKIAFGKYLPVPVKSIIQNDSSNKKSYTRLLLDAPYLVHKLSIEAAGPKYFNRSLEISTTTTRNAHDFTKFALSSNGNSSFPLNGLKSSEFLLTVQNDDNPALKITGAICWQLNQYLLTYLDANKKYHLRFGDSTAMAPVYDLAFFKDSIPANLPQLNYSGIKATNSSQELLKPGGFSKVWMWFTIFAAGLVLLFFTIQLTRQINKTRK